MKKLRKHMRKRFDMNNKCICFIKPSIEDDNYCGYGDNVIDDVKYLGYGAWNGIALDLLFGVQHNGRYVIWATGDDNAEYYPKFCPECGRKLV